MGECSGEVLFNVIHSRESHVECYFIFTTCSSEKVLSLSVLLIRCSADINGHVLYAVTNILLLKLFRKLLR